MKLLPLSLAFFVCTPVVAAQIQAPWVHADAPPDPNGTPFTDLDRKLGWTDWLGQAFELKPIDGYGAIKSIQPGQGDQLRPVAGENFELDFSWAIEAGGNSGLKYRVPREGDRRGPEYQILDDRAFPDLAGKHKTGSLYDVVPQAFAPTFEIDGSWVRGRGRIVALGSRLHHGFGGRPISTADLAAPTWNSDVLASKFKGIADTFAQPRQGALLLQDHGAPVRFEHLFARNLDALPGTRIELFDGKTTDGWQLIGDAKYVPTDEGIFGTITNGNRNAFLATERTFGDFLLEVDVKLDDAGNSGIQIRSQITDNRLRGWQVEIDPSPRSWSGGLYDEARRGWLMNLETNEAGRNAFDHTGWNRYRIECIGPWVRTWINDVPIVDYLDALDLEGHIGLQVHSGKNTALTWRNPVLHDLGKHVWQPVDLFAPAKGYLRSREALTDGAWRIQFKESPEDLRLFLRTSNPEAVGTASVTGRDQDGALTEGGFFHRHPEAGAAVLHLNEHVQRLGKPLPEHANQLDVIHYGRRLAITFGGRPVFTSSDARGLNRTGHLVLGGVALDAIESVHALTPGQ